MKVLILLVGFIGLSFSLWAQDKPSKTPSVVRDTSVKENQYKFKYRVSRPGETPADLNNKELHTGPKIITRHTPKPVEHQTKQVIGKIIDRRLEPLAGAEIKVGKKTYLSDAQGFIRFTAVKSSGGRPVIVRGEKNGFWHQTVRVHLQSGDTTHFTLLLEPYEFTNKIDGSSSATVVNEGVFLTFQADGAVTADGKTYSGPVQLALRRGLPGEPDFGLRMPGGDFEAQGGKMLYSYGFMSAEMQTETGQKLQPAPGKPVKIEFDIAPAERAAAPDTLPLWHFDEKSALWKKEGSVFKKGNKYVGTVSHFSSWNLDYPTDRATVTGIITDCEGKPRAGRAVTAGQRTAFTDENGRYSLFVPKDFSLKVYTNLDSLSIRALPVGTVDTLPTMRASAVMMRPLGVLNPDSTLQVFGSGVDSFSTDGGVKYYPKKHLLKVTDNKIKSGIAKDTFGCTVYFDVLIPPQKTDCQLLDSLYLAKTKEYKSVEEALRSGAPVYKLVTSVSLGRKLLQEEKFSLISKTFTCLQGLELASQLNFGDDGGDWATEDEGELDKLEQQIRTKDPEGYQNFQNATPQVRTPQVSRGHKPKPTKASPSKQRKGPAFDPDDFEGASRLPDAYIPAQVWELTQLRMLFLPQYNLTELPADISRLTHLFHLDLSYNRLTDLPNSISELQHSLKDLYLIGNPIPVSQHQRIQKMLPNTVIHW